MKTKKAWGVLIAFGLLLSGCGGNSANNTQTNSNSSVAGSTSTGASLQTNNDTLPSAQPFPLVDSCIKKLEDKGIDPNSDGMLILKRLSYYLKELSSGTTFMNFKDRFSPIYNFTSFANMMDGDNINKIMNNTLAGRDPYLGLTGLIERAYISETDQTLDSYLVYVPSDYNGNKKYPLIVLLHGYGGGAYLPQDSPVHNQFLSICDKYDVIMVAPNGKNKIPDISIYEDDGEKDVIQVTKLAQKAYNIDTKRTYLTGCSMGGHGTWYIGSRNKDIFAAIAPVCGYADGSNRSKEVPASDLAGMPTYVVHGDMDSVINVSASRTMVKEMQEANMEVVYRELKGVDHNAQDTAYGDEELIKWLLAHEKK